MAEKTAKAATTEKKAETAKTTKTEKAAKTTKAPAAKEAVKTEKAAKAEKEVKAESAAKTTKTAKAEKPAKAANTSKIKITLIKSTIGQVPKTRATIAAMGLRKIGQTVELPDNGATRGQIQKVRHMIKVEEA